MSRSWRSAVVMAQDYVRSACARRARPSQCRRLVSLIMVQIQPGLAGNPDTLRWNARYGAGFTPSFDSHPLAARALAAGPPVGSVLELASGPSGSALLAASAGRAVTAVDASDVGLRLLAAEAQRRGLADLLTLLHADLVTWRPEEASFALVICTGYWDRELFGPAACAVTDGGLIAWEALTAAATRLRPTIPAQWCVGPGEPARLLPAGFEIIDFRDVGEAHTRRQLIARSRRSRG